MKTKTVPKTTSGKIARAWCRKGFLGGTLQVVYRKSFKDSTTTFEIEQAQDAAQQTPLSKDKVQELRSMGKSEILDKLKTDVSRVAGIPPDSIDADTALVTILDSLNLSQFKGLLGSGYAVKISDEYLFRENTTLTKLVEIVKLGYAPDDTQDGDEALAPPRSEEAPGGLAGALGCPPGVVCCVIQ